MSDMYRTLIEFPDVPSALEMYTFGEPPDCDTIVDVARAFYPGERWVAGALTGITSPRMSDIRPEHVRRLMERFLT